MKVENTVVESMNFLTKVYDGLNKQLTSTKNRIAHLNPEAKAKHDDIVIDMESTKGKISRRLEKELYFFPIWEQWMKDIRGVGPWIGAALIKEYYFRFVPICKKCGVDLITEGEDKFSCPECKTKAKGEGILASRIERKDFPKISSWWHYMGCHVENGKKARARKGEAKGGRRGRAIAFQLGEQFIKQNGEHPYKAFYNRVKAKRERTHPDASKLHKHNMARHESAKLFLAHFWMVARELEGLEVTQPYAATLLGEQHNVIQPYFWEPSRV